MCRLCCLGKGAGSGAGGPGWCVGNGGGEVGGWLDFVSDDNSPLSRLRLYSLAS